MATYNSISCLSRDEGAVRLSARLYPHAAHSRSDSVCFGSSRLSKSRDEKIYILCRKCRCE